MQLVAIGENEPALGALRRLDAEFTFVAALDMDQMIDDVAHTNTDLVGELARGVGVVLQYFDELFAHGRHRSETVVRTNGLVNSLMSTATTALFIVPGHPLATTPTTAYYLLEQSEALDI